MSGVPLDAAMAKPEAPRRSAARHLHSSRGSRSYPSRSRNHQRQHRLALGGNSKSQKTLTQINFAQARHYRENHDNLQLIERETTLPDYDEWKTNDKGRQRKRMRRETERPNRTLTQIVNEKWYLTRAEPVGSSQSVPGHCRKRRAVEMEAIAEEVESEAGEEQCNPSQAAFNPIRGERDDNKQTTGIREETLGSDNAAEPEKSFAHGRMLPPPNPITPRKRTRWMIPSSQSPESPEIRLQSPRTPMNTRSSPVRWPLASSSGSRRPSGLSISPIQSRRRSILQFDANDYESQIVNEDDCQHDNDAAEITAPTSPESALSSPRTISDPSVSFMEDINSRLGAIHREQTDQRPQTQDLPQEEAIVYETDGEPDLRTCHDEGSPLPAMSANRNAAEMATEDTQSNQQPAFLSDCGQSSQNLPSSNHMSESLSLYYTRQPMSYVYEKFPTSQYLPACTDDFPDIPESEDNEDVSQPPLHSNVPLAVHMSIPREMGQQSHHDAWESDGSLSDLDPRQPSPVVQVESSQRSEEPRHSNSQASDPERGPQGVITCSQLLTESLMESIPGPPASNTETSSNDRNDLNDHSRERLRHNSKTS